MSDKIRGLESWERVIVDFFEHKVENIKSNNPKTPCKLYKTRKYIEDKEKAIKSETSPKKIEKLITAKEVKQNELNKLRIEAPSTEIRQWIEKTSFQKIAIGKRIIKTTHVLRFSHSSSLSDGLLLEDKSNDTNLTTSSFKKKLTCDLAHNNGALITVSRFLALQLSGKLIIDLILDGNYEFLKPFSENKEQLEIWGSGFDNIVEEREIKTTDKAKQIYFPLIRFDEKTSIDKVKYHLITPLFSSSLAEEIFTIVDNSKFGEEQKDIRKQKKETNEKPPQYHPEPYIHIPSLGVQKFGGAQPQNVSMLNKNRGGKCYLLPTQPPTWQSQLKPPIYKKSLFDNFGNGHIKEDINYLRDFLLRFERIGLSIKDPKRYEHLERWVNSIIDEVLFYTSSIQNLPSAWSASTDIKLKIEHQYFLDPYRDDEGFQNKRESTDWQNVICNDFARWLNNQLKGQDKKFTPQSEHTRLWKQLFEAPLREDRESIKAEAKYSQQKDKV
jgi:CRISPR-associated protein Csy1